MDLALVKWLNGKAARLFPFDVLMDLVCRFGHLVFVVYGIWLWFGGSGAAEEARECFVGAFLRLALFLSFVFDWESVGSSAAVYAGYSDLEFYGAQGECVVSEQSHDECGGGLARTASGGDAGGDFFGGIFGTACVFASLRRDSLFDGFGRRGADRGGRPCGGVPFAPLANDGAGADGIFFVSRFQAAVGNGG